MTPKINRQLAAIMFTDIVGYTSIMQQDENTAREIRNRHREVFKHFTEKHNGRILQYFGDGTLSIFESAIEAVDCAVSMQLAFKEDPAVPLRIGIHTGDIVFSNEEVYGDGVNVASRIEQACTTGAVFISGKVYDDIKNHSALQARSIGAYQLKNIDSPLELYVLTNDGLPFPNIDEISHLRKEYGIPIPVSSPPKVPASAPPPSSSNSTSSPKKRGKSFWLKVLGAFIVIMSIINFTKNQFNSSDPPDESPIIQQAGIDLKNTMPTVAVLPFTNMSGDANDYFSDGIMEDILTSLSQVEGMRVISRTTMMRYKDTEKSIKEIGRELNANTVLEGSVRKQGNRVRIVAQLINAGTDDHIWSQTYDREMDDIFEVQSMVANDIARALQKEVNQDTKERLAKRPTDNISAWDTYLQGRNFYGEYTPEDNDVAIKLFEEAIDQDPDFALAWAGLGDALAQKGRRFEMGEVFLDSALIASTKALKLDPELAEAHKALGLVYHYTGEYELAKEQYLKALDLNPNYSPAIANVGDIYLMDGELDKASRWLARSIEVDPRSTLTINAYAKTMSLLGLYAVSKHWIEHGLNQYPESSELKLTNVDLLFRQKKYDEAKSEALELNVKMPEIVDFNNLLGNIEMLSGNADSAYNFYKRAMDYNKRTHFSDSVSYGFSKIGLAMAEYSQGGKNGRKDLLSAIDLIKSMVGKKPEFDSWLSVQVAMGYAEMKMNDEAFEWLDKAIDKNFIDYNLLEISLFKDNLGNDRRYMKIYQDLRSKVERMRDNIIPIEPVSS